MKCNRAAYKLKGDGNLHNTTHVGYIFEKMGFESSLEKSKIEMSYATIL